MPMPAARITDMHVCPMVTPGLPPIPHVGGPIVSPGAPTVLIAGLPAAAIGSMCVCVGPPDVVIMGSPTVLVSGRPLARSDGSHGARRNDRRWRSNRIGGPMSATLRRAIGVAGAALALVSTACLDDRPVSPEPNDAAAAAVRIGFRATILQAAAGQTVRIRAFYTRTDGTDITLPSSPTEVSVTPGVPQTVGVVVRIATCLADTQRAAPTSNTCQVGIELTLEDENGVPIDQQTSAPPQPLPPGGTTTIGAADHVCAGRCGLDWHHSGAPRGRVPDVHCLGHRCTRQRDRLAEVQVDE